MAESSDTSSKHSRTAALLSNMVAIAGLIVLIVIVLWGLLRLASLSTGWFPSLFSREPAQKGLTVSAPESAQSGEPMTIRWRYSPKSEGGYAFVYRCAPGLQFALPGEDGGAAPVPCGAAIALRGATTSAEMIPILNATSSLVAQFSILYMPRGSADGAPTLPEAQGAASVRIEREARRAQDGLPPRDGSGAGRTLPRGTGPADLAVSIVAIGVIDLATGTIVPRAPLSPSELAAVQFDIVNIGGSPVGTWYFEAELPTAGSPYLYVSPPQAPLMPGDHIVNTLKFTQAQIGGAIRVTVDPMSAIPEALKSNNTAVETLALPAGSSYYYGY